jgi:fructose/tagatose bisphosphate aldolase
VELTGIDTFAAAIGNLHGSYPVPKQLDLRLLTRLKKELNCFISLHGGSGTPLDQFQQAAAIGVTKINVNTDLRIAYKEALQTAMLKNPTEVALIKLMPEVIDAVQNIVEQKIISFNSADRAKV